MSTMTTTRPAVQTESASQNGLDLIDAKLAKVCLALRELGSDFAASVPFMTRGLDESESDAIGDTIAKLQALASKLDFQIFRAADSAGLDYSFQVVGPFAPINTKGGAR